MALIYFWHRRKKKYVQMLIWTDLASKEFECEKGESDLVMGKDSYNFLIKNKNK